jgi:hypothetical protein
MRLVPVQAPPSRESVVREVWLRAPSRITQADVWTSPRGVEKITCLAACGWRGELVVSQREASCGRHRYFNRDGFSRAAAVTRDDSHFGLFTGAPLLTGVTFAHDKNDGATLRGLVLGIDSRDVPVSLSVVLQDTAPWGVQAAAIANGVLGGVSLVLLCLLVAHLLLRSK